MRAKEEGAARKAAVALVDSKLRWAVEELARARAARARRIVRCTIAHKHEHLGKMPSANSTMRHRAGMLTQPPGPGGRPAPLA